ncbi:SMI1/KNR4 family protein [Kitasatospora sp. NPDC007106]|uniref:SMI1/KNR4 family protein n=1 Tax=Kitasatospora sp. NPDC007106 TaxID=3156914 RepID=UPI0033D39726
MAAEVVAEAPEGWAECVLRGHAGRSGFGLRGGGYVVPSRPSGFFHVSFPHQGLAALASRFRESRGWEAIVVELTCRPSGAFGLVVFWDALQPGGGWALTLDSVFWPAEPGVAGDAEPSSGFLPVGDPAGAVERLRVLLGQHAEHSGAPPEMAAPVTGAQLAAAEHRLGRVLPADLRVLYLEADGDGGSEALGGY